MILDTQALFSDDQAITTTADSTNIIEMPKRSAYGTPLRLLILVTETFSGGTSVAIDLETDSTAAFGSAVDIATIAAIAVGTLVQGYEVLIDFMPRLNEEFTRLEYTVIGSPSAGRFTAGIVYDRQYNLRVYPPA